jgi:murein DD-endopeptidase MepM/ murein hydrolase activator NlpD
VIRPPIVLAAALALALFACGDDTTPSPSPTATPLATQTASPTSTPTPSPTSQLLGFPIDPQTVLGEVAGEIGSRTVSFDAAGPTAYDYALDDEPSDDAAVANGSGWNCRTHFEYEGIAAVDFYIAEGTPVLSTISGIARLYAVSTQNDFDRYGVNREPYLGNPHRASAPANPFPGPSAGLAVYVVVEGEGFLTEYGHLSLSRSADTRASGQFGEGFSADSDWDALFGDVTLPRTESLIAEWQVRPGDVVGYSGDAGYSEAPHLHYTIGRAGGELLCPTQESGFTDGGWLFR